MGSAEASADALIGAARELEQAGEFGEAEVLYRGLLDQFPASGEIRFMLGCLCIRAGRPVEGLAPLSEAARMLPEFAEAQIVLGNLLIGLKRWNEAVEALERGVALRPDILPVKANLAMALFSSGSASRATALYEEILESNPANHDARRNLAHVLNERKMFSEAEPHARIAATFAPDSAAALNILGNSLYGLDRLEEAEKAYTRSIAIDPNLQQVHLNLCSVYADRKRYDDAERAARRAIELFPDCAPALDALGMALVELERFDEAIGCFDRLARLDPESEVAVLHKAQAYRRKGMFEEAIEFGRKAVDLDRTPNAIMTRHSLGLDLIRTGRHGEGWSSIQGEEAGDDGVGPQPTWDGSPLEGRTLAVYAIIGLGDAIQFARYLPLVVERARGRIVFECHAGLMDLLGDMPGMAEVVPRGLDHYPADCYISLLSLPALFGTTEESIPSGRLPVRIPEDAVVRWRERLAGVSGLKVGLCWSGSPNYMEDRTRSGHLDMFAPLGAIKGLNLISLQLGPRADEVRSAGHGFDILHVPEDLAPFGRTAALMRELDLVISTCTSVPHLAGALGVETWLLLPFVPPPWWNAYRPNDTPWYPRHRLFRQPRLGDWKSVIERVTQELASRVAGR